MGETIENPLGIKPEDLGEPQADIVEAVETMSKSQSPDEMLKDAAKLLVESEKRHSDELKTAVDALVDFNSNNTKSCSEIRDASKQATECLERSTETLKSAAKTVNELYGPLDDDLNMLELKVKNMETYLYVMGAVLAITFLVAIFK